MSWYIQIAAERTNSRSDTYPELSHSLRNNAILDSEGTLEVGRAMVQDTDRDQEEVIVHLANILASHYHRLSCCRHRLLGDFLGDDAILPQL